MRVRRSEDSFQELAFPVQVLALNSGHQVWWQVLLPSDYLTRPNNPFYYNIMMTLVMKMSVPVPQNRGQRSEDSFVELVLFFHLHMVLGTQHRSPHFCGNHLYSLSHSTAPTFFLPHFFSRLFQLLWLVSWMLVSWFLLSTAAVHGLQGSRFGFSWKLPLTLSIFSK